MQRFHDQRNYGAGPAQRTRDLPTTSQTRFQLSYRPVVLPTIIAYYRCHTPLNVIPFFNGQSFNKAFHVLL